MPMTRFLPLLLSLVLVFLCAAPARAEWRDGMLSADPTVFDLETAKEALRLCTLIYYPEQQAQYMSAAGFIYVGQWNYVRPAGDTRHICAYTIYQKPLDDGRTAVLILIRGTGDDEWALNMDVMPSGDYNLPYAENFTLAAQNIMDTQAAFFAGIESPVFLVAGHSRGGACANVLGKLLTDAYGEKSVYAYTFATPRTVRGEYPTYNNIFNIINPCDYITMMPLAAWGFERYGTDITLPTANATAEQIAAAREDYQHELGNWGDFKVFKDGTAIPDAFIAAVAAFAPTVRDAYETRHSLTGPGLSEDGLTGSEFIMKLSIAILSQDTASLILDVAKMKANGTDFDAILNVLTSAAFSGEINALTMAHMPGTYASFLSLMSR